jgi:hypothetical protein
MKFRSSVFIPRPIDEVFDFAVDQVGSSRWQIQAGVEHLSGEANAPGSTYERTSVLAGQSRVHTFELAVVAPPFRFDVRSLEGPSPFHHDYNFVVEGEGTRVFVDTDSEGESPAEVEGWLKFLRQLIAGETQERTPATRGPAGRPPTGIGRAASWLSLLAVPLIAGEALELAPATRRQARRPPTASGRAAFWLSLVAVPLFNFVMAVVATKEIFVSIPGALLTNLIVIPAVAIALLGSNRSDEPKHSVLGPSGKGLLIGVVVSMGLGLYMLFRALDCLYCGQP